MIASLYGIIPIILVVVFIIIPEYKEFKHLKGILSKLNRISNEKNNRLHHQYYSLTAKNRLIRAITNSLNDLLDKKNILSLSFHSLTIFDFKRTERTYHKINSDIDKLFDKLQITNIRPERYHYKNSAIFNYPILKDIEKKLDTIITRKNLNFKVK
jgi:hypothetical protein